jgi:hypothetical protein
MIAASWRIEDIKTLFIEVRNYFWFILCKETN